MLNCKRLPEAGSDPTIPTKNAEGILILQVPKWNEGTILHFD